MCALLRIINPDLLFWIFYEQKEVSATPTAATTADKIRPEWELWDSDYNDTGFARYKDPATALFWVEQTDGTFDCQPAHFVGAHCFVSDPGCIYANAESIAKILLEPLGLLGEWKKGGSNDFKWGATGSDQCVILALERGDSAHTNLNCAVRMKLDSSIILFTTDGITVVPQESPGAESNVLRLRLNKSQHNDPKLHPRPIVGNHCIVLNSVSFWLPNSTSESDKLLDPLGLTDEWHIQLQKAKTKDFRTKNYDMERGVVLVVMDFESNNGGVCVLRMEVDSALVIIAISGLQIVEAPLPTIHTHKLTNLFNLVMDVVRAELPNTKTLDALGGMFLPTQEQEQAQEQTKQHEDQVAFDVIDTLLHFALSNVEIALPYSTATTANVNTSQQRGMNRCAALHECKIKASSVHPQHVVTSTSTSEMLLYGLMFHHKKVRPKI